MPLDRNAILDRLKSVLVPGGGDLVSRDLVRAIQIEDSSVRFVIEATDPDMARQLEGVRTEAEAAIAELDGVSKVSAVLTAHGPAPAAPKPPSLKIGGHPKPQQGGPQKVTGVDRIIAIGSGKGGVGKVDGVVQSGGGAGASRAAGSGFLDADIYGPSQPQMMGVMKRPCVARWQDRSSRWKPMVSR